MLLKRIDDAAKRYDVIVIGGGLGGMTAANLLASRGASVLLAEQHIELGGLAGYFRRGYHVFDVALHGFPIGMKKTFRRYWSEEMASRIVQVKSVRFSNTQFELDTPFTREDFTRVLVEKFGVGPSVVEDFYKTLEGMNFYDKSDESNRELFERFFQGRNDVVRLLMEPISYANASTLDEPAISYGIVFSNFMSKGVYTFLGGTELMIRMMKRCLDDNGVDYCLGAKTERIAVEKGRVSGVNIAGRFIEARAVVSNANLKTTALDLVGADNFESAFVEELRRVRLNTSSCQVYIGLAPGAKIGDIGELIFHSDEPEYDPAKMLSFDSKSMTFSVYYPWIRPGRSADYTIVASMNARYEDWASLSKDEYSAAKKALEEKALSALEKYVPGIRGALDYIGSATPLTFKRYTLHGAGATFGTKFEGLGPSMRISEHLGGLFHAGSVGIIMSGWLGAANYGVITANSVEKYLASSS